MDECFEPSCYKVLNRPEETEFTEEEKREINEREEAKNKLILDDIMEKLNKKEAEQKKIRIEKRNMNPNEPD